jgi:glycosyltransferase involved in cell wall biosynthesis
MSESNNSDLGVLFVEEWFDKMGGAVTRTTNLLKNLYKYRIDASILTMYLSKEVHSTLIRSNLRKIYVRKQKFHERMPTGLDVFAILSMIIYLFKYLKRHKCDLIYVRPCEEDMLSSLFVCSIKKKPIVIELHHHLGTFEGHAILRFYLRMIEKLMTIFSDKIVVNSWTFYKELRAMYGGGLSKKVCVVPNSIDLNIFRSNSNNSIKSSKQVIGFIGTLKRDEDLLCLVKAAKIVSRKCRNAVFMVVGQDMGLKRELESETERLGLKDNFLLVDKRPYGEIPEMLKTFSLFVAPRVNNERTRYAMPIKILEAMALGVPVVTTSLPPIEELTNDAAILVPPSDHVSLANGILRLLKDHNLRKELIRKGLRRAEKFDSEKIASYFAEVLTTCA